MAEAVTRASASDAAGDWVRVADSQALAAKERLHLQVEGRYVSVLRGKAGALHCLDSICYHTGGPLTIGDIEDINGEPCVKCPWHDYPVRLHDGAKPYQSMKFDPVTKKLTPDGWKFTKNSQRSHEIVDRGEGPDGGLWVRLSTGGKCESDQFAYNASAAKNVWNGDSSFRPDGKSDPSPHGYKRSGEVLAEIRSGKALGAPPPMSSSAVQMHPTEWRPFRILSKKQMTRSMWLFRFALPEGQTLAPPGARWEVERHVRLRLPGHGQQLVREYTPVSPPKRPGSFDLAIKIYEEGAMSSRLARMAPGQVVEMTGLHGDYTISWPSRTIFRAGEAGLQFRSLAFLVAGSGVTPCIQILQDWVAQGEACSSIQMDILYANRTEDEIAFRSELTDLAKLCRSVNVCFAVTNPTEAWGGHRGRIDLDLLRQQLGDAAEATVALVCGPPEFNETMRLHLNSLGFTRVICF
ncbi:unnamed protein product [Cladocopium goreaui]|uniref:Rieske domain-containing protein n=1 Tax=Cladocopium goreaui TaxID=2562237 RepID=A0A9P1CFV9_9DINO|nr:unnamed protein product [Cladocopium goreaui]